jgi:hypothetical protein
VGGRERREEETICEDSRDANWETGRKGGRREVVFLSRGVFRLCLDV